ncbi:MAG: hypothetical protein QGH06_03490 [Lutibacter sp.]|jgi:hypothetical protein|nr:hypothetical protein [Lutibacter sp.]
MKNIFKLFLSLLMVASFNACSEGGDNVVDEVLDHETGAVLRTIEIINATLNSSIPTSEFSVTVEEQDEEDGALLQSMDVYVSMRDLTPENGTTVATDVFIKSVDASAFTAGPHGLPRTTVSMTFGDAATAMGLSSADYAPGDVFEVELRLNLTDGRTFGAASAGGIITGGFFSSPFKYNALIICSPAPGDYRVEMQDSYGDGWQGSGIEITIDDTVVYADLADYWSTGEGPYSSGTFNFTVPAGSSLLTWNYTGDAWPSEVSFQVYGPGNVLLGEFVSPNPGLLPITLCAE